MNIQIQTSASRGTAHYGWLNARYSFSFANYYNPMRERFGMLRVLNDDIIEGGGGFDTHPHNNMEIITIPLSGALRHRDSMGHTSVIRKREVQYMSAGQGVQHSEFNDSPTESLNLLQIWIFPEKRNTPPRYDQINFEGKIIPDQLKVIVSPTGGEDTIQILQQAWLSMLNASPSGVHKYTLHREGIGVFVFVISGKIQINGQSLSERDSAEITGIKEFELETITAAEILFIEVPMQ